MRAKQRRAAAASVTVSAGAVAFLAFGAAPAAAQTQAAQAGADCKLGTLLCGILGGGASGPSTAPTSGTSTAPEPAPKPTAAPKPAPKPKAAPARAHHSGASGGTAPRPAVRAPSGLGGDAPAVPVPQDRPTPVLPDVTAQDPVVFPEPSGGAPAPARLVAAGDDRPRQGTIPPLLVATASGLAGAMAAINVSVLRRRIRDSHER